MKKTLLFYFGLVFIYISCTTKAKNKNKENIYSISINRHTTKKKSNRVITDTIENFVKNNLYDCSLIDLSFCQNELAELLHKYGNDTCILEREINLPKYALKISYDTLTYSNLWLKKINNLNKIYNDSISNISTRMEIAFFKNRLIKKVPIHIMTFVIFVSFSFQRVHEDFLSVYSST